MKIKIFTILFSLIAFFSSYAVASNNNSRINGYEPNNYELYAAAYYEINELPNEVPENLMKLETFLAQLNTQ